MHYKILNAFFSSLHLGFIKVCKTFKMGLGWEFKVELLNMWKYTNQKKKTICAFGIKLGHRFAIDLFITQTTWTWEKLATSSLKSTLWLTRRATSKWQKVQNSWERISYFFNFIKLLFHNFMNELFPQISFDWKAFQRKVLTFVKTFSNVAWSIHI
jgi:hypothetical protein